MQLLHDTSLSCKRYVIEKGWQSASLSRCPNHPKGKCGFHRNGFYRRKTSWGYAQIVRYYCRQSHQSFSLLPIFFSAHMPGTLDEIEQVVVHLEQGRTARFAAAEVRGAGKIEGPGYRIWALRRERALRRCLGMLVTLLADLFAPHFMTEVRDLRAHLGTEHLLITLRRHARDQLQHIVVPVGFRPP